MNKSRAGWRATVNKIPIQVNDLDKVPEISNDIKSMMRSHSKVFLEKEAPYCFLSRIESSFAELTLVCNLRHMVIPKTLPLSLNFICFSSSCFQFTFYCILIPTF